MGKKPIQSKKDESLCCPPDINNCPKSACNKNTLELEYASNKSVMLIVNGVIGGLALAIALILQQPIMALVQLTGITNETAITLITIAIYFLFAVGLVFILMSLNRKENMYKRIADHNKYEL